MQPLHLDIYLYILFIYCQFSLFTLYLIMKKELNPKPRLTFYQILSLFFLTLSIVISLISISYYLIARSIIMKQEEDHAQRDLHQISYTENLLTDLAHSAASQLYSDPSMNRLLFFDQIDIQTMSVGLSKLDRFRWSNPHIHSIYLFNSKMKMFFISDNDADRSIQSLEELQDYHLTKLLTDNSPQDLEMHLFPRTLELKLNHKYMTTSVPVLTLFYFGNRSTAPACNSSSVIVNLSESWIRKTMDSLNTSDSYTVSFLVPSFKNEEPYIFPFSVPETTQESQKNLIDFVTQTDSIYSRRLFINDGKEELISVYHPGSSKWRFFTRSDYNAVMHSLRGLRTLSLLLSATALIFGALISIVGSLKIYKPIKQFSDHLSSMEKERNRDRKRLQSEIFSNLIFSKRKWPDSLFLKTLNDFQILDENIFLNRKVLPLIITLPAQGNKSDSFTTIFKNYFVNYSEAMTAIELTSNQLYCFHLILIKKDYMIYQSLIESFLDTNSSLCITIGPIATNLADLPKAVKSTLKVSAYLYTYGYGSLIIGSQISPEPAPDGKQIESRFKEISTNTLDADWPSVKNNVHEVIKSLKKKDPEISKSIILNLIYHLQDLVHTIKNYYHKNFLRAYYKMYSFATEALTIWHCETIIQSFLHDLISAIEEEKSTRQIKIAEKITDYIKENYSDTGLYVQKIADELHFSAPYLGRIYHQQTGTSIPEAINCYRIEQACTHLIETKEPIESIASKAGFSSKHYFYRIFKKYKGTTPNIYRKTKTNTNT